jgi:hypothetical protein
VGAVVPCGHCFHFECFGLWRASKGRNCKCPNCNKPSEKCIKIFISPPDSAGGGYNDDDDDVSLHSTDTNPEEEEKDQKDDGEEEGSSSSVMGEQQVPEPEELPHQQVVEPDSINVVDLTQSPQRSRAAPAQLARSSSLPSASLTETNTTPEEGEGGEQPRFKAIAKRYKRRFQQKDSQFREQYQQHQTLLQTCAQMKEDLQEANEELRETHEYDERNAALLDAAKLRNIQLERQSHQQQTRLQTLQDQKEILESKHSKLQTDFAKAVEKARNSDMAEVQELLKERPKIIEENQRLKRDIAKITMELSDLRRLVRTHHQSGRTSSTTSSTTSTNQSKVASLPRARNNVFNPLLLPQAPVGSSPTKKRKAYSMAKDLRAMAAVQYSNDPVEPLEETSGRKTNNNLSAMGNRMAAFMQKKQQSKLTQQYDRQQQGLTKSAAALLDNTNTNVLLRRPSKTKDVFQRSNSLNNPLAEAHRMNSSRSVGGGSSNRTKSTTKVSVRASSGPVVIERTSINLHSKRKEPRPLHFGNT